MFSKERLTVILALLSFSVFGEGRMLTIPSSPPASNSLNDGELVSAVGQPLEYLVSPRIVGGRDADDGQFPHQISLRQRGSHICGGSIISPLYVVTAAHCVTSRLGRRTPASTLSIRAGSNDRNSGGSIVSVAQVIVHPDYRNLNNDIALLKLSTPLAFNNNIKAAPLALKYPEESSSIDVSGWGRLRTLGQVPTHLKFNTLRSLSSEQCRQAVGDRRGSILCLGHTRGNGACMGDSGGPAIDAAGRLVGVANFVVNGCGSSSPDFYASISNLREWIMEISGL